MLDLNNSYNAPAWLFHPHMETIYSSVFRQVYFNRYLEEQISTPDDDYLDLDWSTQGSDTLIVLCHGLEGNSRRPYMKGMAKFLFKEGYDILSWNYRSCGPSPNKQVRSYHSGATDDLDLVMSHAIKKDVYQKIGLVGFSLGGNLVLKYLGETWENRKWINACVAISVPVDLEGCSQEIAKPKNWIYTNRFLSTLRKKVKQKSLIFPNEFNTSYLVNVKTVRDFDDLYTAPLHGFKNATDYYSQCSALRFMPDIVIPTLILNAQNDSFLGPSCFPTELAAKHPFIDLRITIRGGHVGFSSNTGSGIFYSERTAVAFFREKLPPKI